MAKRRLWCGILTVLSIGACNGDGGVAPGDAMLDAAPGDASDAMPSVA